MLGGGALRRVELTERHAGRKGRCELAGGAERARADRERRCVGARGIREVERGRDVA